MEVYLHRVNLFRVYYIICIDMVSKWVTCRLRYRNYIKLSHSRSTLDCHSYHSRMSNREVADSRVLRNSLTRLSPFTFKARSGRIIYFYFLAVTKSRTKNFCPPFHFASMDRVLRSGDWELVKQRNKLLNVRTKFPTNRLLRCF